MRLPSVSRVLLGTLTVAVLSFVAVKEWNMYWTHYDESGQMIGEQTDLYAKHNCDGCLGDERRGVGTCARHLNCHSLMSWNNRSAYIDAAMNTVTAHNPCSGSDACYYGTMIGAIVVVVVTLYASWLWLWWLIAPATSPLARSLDGARYADAAREAEKAREIEREREAAAAAARRRRQRDVVPDMFADGYVGR